MKQFLFESYMVVLPVLMGYLVWLLKEQRQDRKADKIGTKTLLMVQLIEYHDKYMPLGKIPSYAYDNFQKMYEAYEMLGDGNRVIEKMKRNVDNLEIKNNEGSLFDGT